VLDVPSVGGDSIIFVSDLKRSGLEYLINDEWPLPWGRESASILATLKLSKDQVPDLELAGAHVALVVASQGLLVLG
jgi:hypothetical protein